MLDINTLIESKDIYLTAFPDGTQFGYRLLTVKEYHVFRALRQGGFEAPFALYNQVFDRCYLGEASLIDENLPAGIFVTIGELIMYLSGDAAGQSDRDDIEVARENYPGSTVDELMRRTVLLAFSSYTPDDLDNWTRQELLRKFPIAEAVLVDRNVLAKGEFQPFDLRHILTPEQAAARAKKPAHGIDIDAQNREHNQAMGDTTHILDQHPDELKRRMHKAKKLERAQAQQLDRINRRRRK